MAKQKKLKDHIREYQREMPGMSYSTARIRVLEQRRMVRIMKHQCPEHGTALTQGDSPERPVACPRTGCNYFLEAINE